MSVIPSQKYFDRVLDPKRLSQGVALVFHEKHDDRRFNVKCQDDVFKVCLKIVKERFEDGWYSGEASAVPTYPVDAVEKIIADLKVKGAQSHEYDYLTKQVQSWRYSVKNVVEENKFLEQVKEAIKEKSGKLAYLILESRQDGEYEGFELDAFESVED